MSQIVIKKNQVVWAKLKGYPWWPSSVSSVNGQDVVVNFLGENSHATVRSNQVFDFKESYGQFIKGVSDRKKKLKEAVAIALRISEGKTTYDEERRTMDKFYQMDEEDDDDEGIDQGPDELNDGISDSISKNTSSVTKNRSARKAQPKRISSVNELNEGKLNTADNGLPNLGRNDPHGEFSLSVEEKVNQDHTHSVSDYNNTPSNLDSCSYNNNNTIGKSQKNNQNVAIEEKNELAFPLGDDTNDSNHNATNNNVDLVIPQEDQHQSDLGVMTAGQSDIVQQEKELRRRIEEAEEEDIELEKMNRINTIKGVNNISSNNMNNTSTTATQNLTNNLSESVPLSFSGRPQRTKRKNGLQMQFLSEQPWKKQHLNGNSSLVSTLESLLHTISTMNNKPNNSIPSTSSSTKLLKDIDAACSQFEISSMNAADLIKAGVGKLFFSIQTFISVMKQQEFQGMYAKLGKVLEGIRDKVLVEALGEDILEHRLFRKMSNANSNGDHIRSDKSQGQQHEQQPQQDQEDHKKLKEKQLRQKVFKKLSDLLMTHHALNKEISWRISTGVEKKIYTVQPELSSEYRNHVKGLIRIIKNKEISAENLESGSVEELLQMIKIENIQADLKASGVQFDKATLNDNDED